jgi:hypothetical protein
MRPLRQLAHSHLVRSALSAGRQDFEVPPWASVARARGWLIASFQFVATRSVSVPRAVISWAACRQRAPFSPVSHVAPGKLPMAGMLEACGTGMAALALVSRVVESVRPPRAASATVH